MILFQNVGSETFLTKKMFFFLGEIETRVWVLQDGGAQRGHGGSSPAVSSASTEKFAPRFDGLRFIETLITAHR